jgi:hypothetical protein
VEKIMHYVVGVDIGGTFTDCVVVDEAGRVTIGKSLSTPADFSRGALNTAAPAKIGGGSARFALLSPANAGSLVSLWTASICCGNFIAPRAPYWWIPTS